MSMSVLEASALVSRHGSDVYGGDVKVMSLAMEKKPGSYAWKEVGYTTCSESCLGGIFSNCSFSVYS